MALQSWSEEARFSRQLARYRNIAVVTSVQYWGQWPRKLMWVHNLTEHGMFYPVVLALRMANTDCWLLWVTLVLHICVPNVWESTVECLASVDDWHGWMLTF